MTYLSTTLGVGRALVIGPQGRLFQAILLVVLLSSAALGAINGAAAAKDGTDYSDYMDEYSTSMDDAQAELNADMESGGIRSKIVYSMVKPLSLLAFKLAEIGASLGYKHPTAAVYFAEAVGPLNVLIIFGALIHQLRLIRSEVLA